MTALTQIGLFDGISPPLISSQALDLTDIAKIASEILSLDIVRETVSDAEYRTGFVAHGLPEVMADGLGSLDKASRARIHSRRSDAGAPAKPRPRTMKDVLKDSLSEAVSKLPQMDQRMRT